MKLITILILFSFCALSADNIYAPKTSPDQRMQSADGRNWPASVVYTTDGIGNVVPIGSSAVTIGTVIQGAAGASPWAMNLSTIFGAAPSATNYLPFRLTDGTSYLASLPVSIATMPTTPVTGTFWQTTQPTNIKGGTDATVIGNIGDELKVVAEPYSYQIAGNAIAGHSPVHILGYSTGVGATRVDIWESAAASTYVFPATPIQMQVVSSSASDAAAGTGIRTVDIEYLDTSYNMQTERVTLNGVTVVNTVATNILRVNNFHAMSVGSTGASVGNIQLQSVGGAVVYSRITAGSNFARQAIYTVPLGKRLFMSGVVFSTTTAAAGHSQTMTIRTTSTSSDELTPGLFMYRHIALIDNNSLVKDFTFPITIPATADVKATCQSDGANAAICVASIEGWIE